MSFPYLEFEVEITLVAGPGAVDGHLTTHLHGEGANQYTCSQNIGVSPI